MAEFLLILTGLVVTVKLARWAFLPARHLPGNRARTLRLRLFLRLHPGRGFATVFGLHWRWGRLAAGWSWPHQYGGASRVRKSIVVPGCWAH